MALIKASEQQLSSPTPLLVRVQSDLFFLVQYHPDIFRIAPSDSILGRKWNKLYLIASMHRQAMSMFNWNHIKVRDRRAITSVLSWV